MSLKSVRILVACNKLYKRRDRINGRLLLHCIQSVRKFIGETSTTPSLLRASDKVVERDLLFPLVGVIDEVRGPRLPMSPEQMSDMFLKMVWAIPGKLLLVICFFFANPLCSSTRHYLTFCLNYLQAGRISS